MTEPEQSREQQVEEAQARLAAYAALAAAAAVLVAVGLYIIALKDIDVSSKASLLSAIDDHSAQLIVSSLFRSVSFALLGIVLGFLAIAAKRRMPQLPALTVPVAYGGPALVAISAPLTMLAQVDAAQTFMDGPARTVKAAEAALDSTFVTISQYVSVFAGMLLAVAWIVIGLYCIKCGLLTRIVGGVAIGIGVLTVLSVYGPSVLALLIEFFWLAAVAVMLLAEEQTRPPAWKLGVAVPWSEVAAAKAAETDAP
jgi:hypothetical protein